MFSSFYLGELLERSGVPAFLQIDKNCCWCCLSHFVSASLVWTARSCRIQYPAKSRCVTSQFKFNLTGIDTGQSPKYGKRYNISKKKGAIHEQNRANRDLYVNVHEVKTNTALLVN